MLKKILILCALFVFVPSMAGAATNIAVVDMQKLLTASDAAKDIQAQVDKFKDAFVSDITKQEQELRNEEKELSGQQGKLDKEEFSKKVKAFEKKLIETRKDAQNKRRKLDEAVTKAVGQLKNKIYEVVQGVADEKGYNLVISKQNVVVGENSLDITDESLKRLNKAVSKIKVSVPK